MISLPDVTLLALDCTNRINGTVRALEICREEIKFGAVKVLAHVMPEVLPEGIVFEETPNLNTLDLYSNYMFFELIKHVDTEYVLTAQDHGYILYPELWDDKWLEYDYIGAPWLYHPIGYVCAETREHVRVGNGGFSLRRRNIMEIPSKYGMQLLQERNVYNEDINICVYNRKKMLELGVKYAPIDVASRFSYENLMQENYGIKPFGYHNNRPIKTWSD